MTVFLGKTSVLASLILSVSVMGQTPPAATAAQDPWPPIGVSVPGLAGVKPAVPVSQVQPAYTREAARAKLQGNVVMSIVVQPDGTVGAVRVMRSLDPGLDENAVAAVRQWKFRPGTKDGAPVAVLFTMSLAFRLSGEPPPAPPVNTPAPFTWPDGFSPELDTSVPGPGWTDDLEETATVKLHVSFPSRWTLKKGSGANEWVTLLSQDASSLLIIGVTRPSPVPFSLIPMPQTVLDQMGAGLSKMPGFEGSEIRKVGQARSSEQFWLWLDLSRPLDPATMPPEAQRLFSLARPGLRGITFMTSAGKENVMVVCTMIVSKEVSTEDAEVQFRKAGAEFVAVVARMTVQVR